MKKNTPAVAYLRASTEKQEESIPRQRAEVKAYAERHGYKILKEYIDDGISGDATEKRVAFLRMREDAARGDFEVVLCWDQSRFGRFDQIDAGHWIYPFRKAGVTLVTVDAGPVDWESATGQLINFGVNQMGKKAYLTDLSKNVMSGMLRAAQRGEWQGPSPYGYLLKDKHLHPDPDALPIVREIFERYARTEISARALAFDLNARGILPPSAGRANDKAHKAALWGRTTILKILRCQTYLGRTVWNKTNVSKYHTLSAGGIQTRPREKGLQNEAADWVPREDTHEAIIDAATWEVVQRRMAERSVDKTAHRKGGHLFTGIVKCGQCGYPMHAQSNAKIKGGRGVVYVCSGGNAGRCRMRRVYESELNDLCSAWVVSHVLDPKERGEWQAEVERRLLAASRTDPGELARQRAALAALDKKIDHGTERYLTAPAALTAALAAKLEAWRGERAALAEQVGTLEQNAAQAGDAKAVARAVVKGMEELHRALTEGDYEARRTVFHKVYENVTVFFEDVPVKSIVRSIVSDFRIKIRADAFLVRNLASELTTLLDCRGKRRRRCSRG